MTLRIPGAPLTARQTEVLHLADTGHTPAQIAAILGLSQATISGHLDRARRKTPPSPTAPAPPVPPPSPLDTLAALAVEASRRQLTTTQARHLLAGIKALRGAHAEIRRLRALTADYEQVIRNQRAEILATVDTLRSTP
ncbi:LuxR C-terminal-related transcriptional regulator [Kitasatospora sp. NPDC050543]|uniref:LuxR C-terminal-related transcriptional regulator n=1 Tax=Kitasatospora sp. NPDC050543 TaxID=3364054 RepID=UPI0037998C23